MSEAYNVASALADMAARAPYQPAIIFPAGRDAAGRAKVVQLSFLQLNETCDQYAHGFHALGIGTGDRVLLLVRPGIELIAVVFALLKLGAVPVMIDPGMGRRAFLQCVAETEPRAMIGLRIAHLLRRVFPRPFATVEHTVVVGEGKRLDKVLADSSLDCIRIQGAGPFPIAETTVDSEAAVAFTSGSTGIPKGVVYLHGMLKAQIELLRDTIGIQPGEVDLALLYIFAFFNPALGVTTVIPDMDPTKSAEVNPAYVVEAIQTHGVTNAFGSPTIWKRVAPYCLEHGIELPSLKRVLMAGAPVPPSLIGTLQAQVLNEQAEILTPFGATEAMPLTWMSGREITAETAPLTETGHGMCVGAALPGIEIKVIAMTDDVIADWDERLVVPVGQIGEIAVKGPVVTRSYLNRPEQTALAKIRDGDEIWHRMGDVGYFDERGRLWFCGRKSHRVRTAQGTLYPVMCEAIFNQHPEVHRTALVGVGPENDQTPVLVVEPLPEAFPGTLLDRQRFALELLGLGALHERTCGIGRVLFYPGAFPTDVRHNVKIQREKLAVWASGKLPELRESRQLLPGLDSERGGASPVRAGGSPHRVGDLTKLVVPLMVGLGLGLWLLLTRLRAPSSANDGDSD
jgi:olefin beta-lactone synthetase